MLEFWHDLLRESPFIPHGHCYLWKPGLVGLHVVSDSLITLAYFSIPITLVYFVRQRQDLPFNWIFLLFGSFIILCGMTHGVEVLTLWHPFYWISGIMKGTTASVSLVTAGVLVNLMPKVLAIPSPQQLTEANEKLAAEIETRQKFEEELRRSQQMLQLVINNIPQLIFWKDCDSVYLGCNQSFAELVGVKKPDEIVGKTDSELVWREEEASLYAAFDDTVIETNKAIYHVIQSKEMIDGQSFWLDLSKIPLYDAEGNVIGVLGTVEDISDRKTAELTLQKLNEELEIRVEERTAELSQAVELLKCEIDERQEAQEALVESEKRLRDILDHSPMAIYVKNTQGQYLLMNHKYASILNVNPDEIKGYSDFEIFPEKVAEIHQQQEIQIIASGKALEAEEVIEQEDGKHTYIGVKFPLYDSNGFVYGVCSISTDISDRKQAEEAIHQSENRFRELVKQEKIVNRLASQIRSSLDLNTILETAVTEIRQLLQVDRVLFVWYHPEKEFPCWEICQEAKKSALPSLVGTKTSAVKLGVITRKALKRQIIRLSDVDKAYNPIEKVFFQELGYKAILAIPVHTQSGEIGIISCSLSDQPRRWQNSEIKLLQRVADQMAIAIDQAELYHQSRLAAITAQTKAEELEKTLTQLKRTQLQLLQSEKMASLGQLVAGVAHEINNPVNFIHGNLTHATNYTKDLLGLVNLYRESYPNPIPEIEEEIEAIELDFLEDDFPKVLASMQVGTTRIREIVKSLRNFSRLDEAEMKSVDIHEGIDNTLMILFNRLKAKPHSSEIEVVKVYGTLPQIECYPGQLNQVFMNLLSNAIDALEEFRLEDSTRKPTITITTEILDGESVIVRITDNAKGMEPDVANKIFDPFFTTKPVGQGTGLGLSISYQIIIDKHRGTLECYSEPGQGTEFVVKLPLR